MRNPWACVVGIITMFSFLLAHTIAVALEIQVVSDTTLNANCRSIPGGAQINFRLSDDLNQGVQAQVCLHEKGNNNALCGFTNAFGEGHIDIAAEPGAYQWQLRFEKAHGYLASSSIIECKVELADIQLAWDLEAYHYRKPSNTLDIRFQYAISAHSQNWELRLSLQPLDTKTIHLHNPDGTTPYTIRGAANLPYGIYPLYATFLAPSGYKEQSLLSHIVLYEKANLHIAQMAMEQNTLHAEGMIALDGIQENEELALSFLMLDEQENIRLSMPFIAYNQKPFTLNADTSELSPGNYTIQWHLLGDEKILQTSRWTKSPSTLSTWLGWGSAMFFAFLILSFLMPFARVWLKTKFQRKPSVVLEPPQQFTLNYGACPHSSGATPTLGINVFNNQGKGIQAHIEILAHGIPCLEQPTNANGYLALPPLEQKTTYTLKLRAKGYLSVEFNFTKQDFKAFSTATIRLTEVREYAIQLFNQLTRMHYPYRSLWGMRTPREFLSHWQEEKKISVPDPILHETIEQFEALCFRDALATNEDANALYSTLKSMGL